ncbi:CDP-diacylglycerol--glycerol-3-phosphate 3-phosphatidyltransferase like protein [Verticillium longisporum]|nr:CDP-diacylglycerol--glycerol-3-phosphate 3-phosphatidyltransferase like protein [Verticillium longisporum]
MFVRSTPRCASQVRAAVARARPSYASPQARAYSTPAAAAPVSSSPFGGPLVSFMNKLDELAPSFDINGSQIEIIREPAGFYETLKGRIRNAKNRIFLSTLYIGKTERELIATIQEALRKNPELKLHILTDALRGTREAPKQSCASLLAPLVTEFGPDRVEIRMYHTPNLTGWRKKLMPRRINEGWGLQHMKLYGVDDEIILSGANLSNDYFTNRQDRYHLFSSKAVTDYFYDIHRTVSSFSFLVEPTRERAGFELAWPVTNAAPSPLDSPEKFVETTSSTLARLISPRKTPSRDESKDTRVYMTAQMAQLLNRGASTDQPVIRSLLNFMRQEKTTWTFTAGYFNPSRSLQAALIAAHSSEGQNVVITAGPEANGFFNAPGVAGLLPGAYTYYLRHFAHAVHSAGTEDSIKLKEWRRGVVGTPGGWSYHAKGIWVTLPGEETPCVTSIGSSNYTNRSYTHDLEAGALVVTRDQDLKRRLGEEQAWLQEYATLTTREDFETEERQVGWKVKAAMRIVRLLGGAL